MKKSTSNENTRMQEGQKSLQAKFFACVYAFGLMTFCSFSFVPRLAWAAGTIYVDLKTSSASCAKYNPSSRSCGSGTDTAYKTIAEAAAAATPGTTVILREGSYNEPLAPSTSGAPGQYITFKNHGSEQVLLGGETGIVLSNRRYIWIEGLRVEDRFWLEANNSEADFATNFQNRSFHVVKNCVFKRTPATGTTGNVRFVRSHDNRFLDNTVEDGVDNTENALQVQGNPRSWAR
ncbi:MAG: hypothetical protein FJ147_18505 [Deltaproteobacteria bacterium]|nr:hypothetical protein [Deltaproteobacteria bacterium]